MTDTAARSPSRRRAETKPAVLIGGLGMVLVLALLTGVLIGDVSIPAGEAVRIVLHHLGLQSGPAAWPAAHDAIIWQLRLPRVLAAALVGAALATAGALLQAILRNPLADPYVIGTSAGAQLGVVLSWLLPVQISLFGFTSLQALAFVGALATIIFVYGLARTGARTPVVTLLLAGFVVSSFLISGSSLLMEFSGRANAVLGWTMGNVAVSDYAQLGAVAPLIALAAAAALLMAGRLDVLSLGEQHAEHLGVNPERVKISAIFLAALLTALAVSLAGVVAFVGLVVPHAVRLVQGPAHRTLLPAVALGGAVFLLAADIISRVFTPQTPLPLGVVTAVIGAPWFLQLLRHGRRDYAL